MPMTVHGLGDIPLIRTIVMGFYAVLIAISLFVCFGIGIIITEREHFRCCSWIIVVGTVVTFGVFFGFLFDASVLKLRGSFWQFCQGRVASSVLLSCMTLIFLNSVLLVIYCCCMEPIRESLCSKLWIAIGVILTICFFVLSITIVVHYSQMYGDYIYNPQEGIEVKCLREPKDEKEQQEVKEMLIDDVGNDEKLLIENEVEEFVNARTKKIMVIVIVTCVFFAFFISWGWALVIFIQYGHQPIPVS
jgi:hypothetical protein